MSEGTYGAPGGGRSLGISVATAVALFALWYGVTAAGWVHPLFLPSPGAVAGRLVEVATEGFGGATLWQHIWASSSRVALAFLLAVVTGVPAGILMGVSRVAELVAAQAGIGAMIQQASDFLVSDVVVMGIVVIGVIAYTSDLAMRGLERWLTPWRGKM